MAVGDIGTNLGTTRVGGSVAKGGATSFKVASGIICEYFEGTLATYPVSASGVVGAAIDTWTIAASMYYGYAREIATGIFLLVHRGVGAQTDHVGVKTFAISSSGIITKSLISAIDTAVHNISGSGIQVPCQKWGTNMIVFSANNNTAGQRCSVGTVTFNSDGTGLTLVDTYIIPNGTYSDPVFVNWIVGNIYSFVYYISDLSYNTHIETHTITDAGVITDTPLASVNLTDQLKAVAGASLVNNIVLVLTYNRTNWNQAYVHSYLIGTDGSITLCDSEIIGNTGSYVVDNEAVTYMGVDSGNCFFIVAYRGSSAYIGYVQSVYTNAAGIITYGSRVTIGSGFAAGIYQIPLYVIDGDPGVMCVGWSFTPGSYHEWTMFYYDNPVNMYFTSGLILELAFNQAWNTVAPTWTDVTEELIGFNTHRGRLHDLDKIEAGTMNLTMINNSGNWWRTNPVSAYYPYLKPLTLVRLRYSDEGTYYPIWYGLTEEFNPDWIEKRGGWDPIMLLNCVDIFKCFARSKLYGTNPALAADAAAAQNQIQVVSLENIHDGQFLRIYDDDNPTGENFQIDALDTSTNTITALTNLVGSYTAAKNAKVKKFPPVIPSYRMIDILVEVGWPVALSTLAAGQFDLAELVPPAEGTPVMEHINDVCIAEGGRAFISRAGLFIFEDSLTRQTSYATEQALFSDLE